MKNIRPSLYLWVIPGLGLSLSLFLKTASGPFWRYADPSYIYLINGLHFLSGTPQSEIEHPGSTLQLLISLVIWISHLGSSVTSMVTSVLKDPEATLFITYLISVTAAFLTLGLLGLYVYRKTKSLQAGLLAQLPLLTFLVTKSFSSLWPVPPVVCSVFPDLLLVSCLNCFNLLLLKLYFSSTSKEKIIPAILLGIICGFAMGTKIVFGPLILGVLLLLPWQLSFVFLPAAVFSYLIWTFPISRDYAAVWAWVTSVGTHTGVYGDGHKGFIDVSTFINNLKIMIPGYWPFMGLSAAAFVIGAKNFLNNRQNQWAYYLVILTGIVFIQWVLVAKHFSAHYLLSAISLFSSIFVLLYINFSCYGLFRKAVSLCIALFVLITSIQAIAYRLDMSALNKGIDRFQANLKARYPNAVLVTAGDGNPLFSQNYALLFGDFFYSRYLQNRSYSHRYAKELSTLYPETYYMNFDGTSQSADNLGLGLCSFTSRVHMDDLIKKYPYVLFIDYKFDFYLRAGFNFKDQPFLGHLLESNTYANVYQITESTDEISDNLFKASMAALKQGRLQEAFMFGLKSKELHYQPQGQVDYFLSIIYQQLHNK